MKPSRWVMALALLAATAACQPDDVERALGDRYGPCWIYRSDAGELDVVFRDSPFAYRAPEERERTARKVAVYVRDHDPRYKGVRVVHVAFQSKKESTIFDWKNLMAAYTFTRAQLGEPAAAHPPADTTAPASP